MADAIRAQLRRLAPLFRRKGFTSCGLDHVALMAWSKESRQSRGYGAAWDRIRKRIMARDFGLCQPCQRKGRVTIATAVDHIVSKAKAKLLRWSAARMDADENLQAICDPCHVAKTAEEQGKSAPQPKKTVGPDGWPV